jgi:cell division protein FtsN
MTKGYGRRPIRHAGSSSTKSLFWMLTSFLCGYLTAAVFDFASLSSWVRANLLTKQNKEKAKVHVVAKQAELPPKPKFEFYTLLAKDKGALVPLKQPTASEQMKPKTLQTATAAVSESSAPLAENSSKESYLIQIASFKNRQDAEHMKAELTLKGFDVRIVNTSQQQGNWFRVIVGPFNSRLSAEKAQLALMQSEHIKGMIRKMAS